MNWLEEIIEDVESLPAERQVEVFDFVAFLKSRERLSVPSDWRAKRAQIESLAGILSQDPITRQPQGIYEVRERVL